MGSIRMAREGRRGCWVLVVVNKEHSCLFLWMQRLLAAVHDVSEDPSQNGDKYQPPPPSNLVLTLSLFKLV